MSETPTNLIHFYTRYKSERARIKERQRQELERELAPFAVDLGRAITQEQANGKRIDDVGYLLGLRNRTFIYKMKRAFDEDSTVIPETLDTPPQSEDTESNEPAYRILGNEHEYEYVVEFANGERVLIERDIEGELVTPDEWLTAPREQRKVYAQIIQEIENRNEHA